MLKFAHLIPAALALSLPAVSVASDQAQQFDLICNGQQQFRPLMKPLPVTHHYRIDLEAKRWCWEKCTFANNIQSVTVDRITFYENGAGDPVKHAYISRTDGSYLRIDLGKFFTNDKGTCEVAPFSGLPAPKF